MAETRLMRTSIYTGGTSPVKMIQAAFYNEDCIVYDLEDSVSAGEKDAARFLVYNAVKYQRPADKYIIVRDPHPEGGVRGRGAADRRKGHRH